MRRYKHVLESGDEQVDHEHDGHEQEGKHEERGDPRAVRTRAVNLPALVHRDADLVSTRWNTHDYTRNYVPCCIIRACKYLNWDSHKCLVGCFLSNQHGFHYLQIPVFDLFNAPALTDAPSKLEKKSYLRLVQKVSIIKSRNLTQNSIYDNFYSTNK